MNNKTDLKPETTAEVVENNAKVKKKKEPMDKQDKLCYAGAIFFLFLAFLPVILRNLDPNYGMDVGGGNVTPTEVKTNTLLCNRDVNEADYSYHVEIESHYVNNIVNVTNISYEVEMKPGVTLEMEDVDIPDYTTITSLDSKGVTRGLEENTLTVRIDYSADIDLLNNDALANHNKNLAVQQSNYEENNYMCVLK